MTRIQKVSTYLIGIFNFLLIGYPLFSLTLWLLMGVDPIKRCIAQGLIFSPVNTPDGPVNLSAVNWTPLSKFIDLMANFVGMIPILVGLFILRAVFRNYKKGEIFNAYNARHYKYLGWVFFLDALIVTPLSNMLMVLAVTLSNPPGHRIINLTFGTLNVETLFCGVLVIVISWVMLEGYKLQEEQKYIV